MGAALKNTFIASVTQINPAIIFSYPIGSIGAWHKTFTNTPALPAEWLECNGQVINDAQSPYNGQNMPDLNTTNRFLRGNATSGTTGGQETATTSGDNTEQTAGVGVTAHCAVHGHTHTVDTVPPYMNVVWIMRIK
jgi:hypothetical protein